MSAKLEDAGYRARGGKEKEWTDSVADDIRMFLDQGVIEEPPHQNPGRKRKVKKADRVVIAPRVTAGKLRRFRAALNSRLITRFSKAAPAAPIDMRISVT